MHALIFNIDFDFNLSANVKGEGEFKCRNS